MPIHLERVFKASILFKGHSISEITMLQCVLCYLILKGNKITIVVVKMQHSHNANPSRGGI